MNTARSNPTLLQINTRILLNELSEAAGRSRTLADVPDAYWDEIAETGYDMVWLLGIWQTGEAGVKISREHPALQEEYARSLSTFTSDDVVGSPFAVCEYRVHQAFGGDAALAIVRKKLAQRGVRLMLDFVPNHVATDHAWVKSHPEYLIAGNQDDLEREPGNWALVPSTDGTERVFACGRDPYFPGWTDTLQLNYRHAGLRSAMQSELLRVAGMCDAIRCDMAMLLLTDVFAQTWSDRAIPVDGNFADSSEFWPTAIEAVRGAFPQCVFLAEVYWNLEWKLQQQGFHFTYDKTLYDRLKHDHAGSVRQHLHAEMPYQLASARFIENHDEPRAAAAFSWNTHQAAAVITLLVPGLRFVHDGQTTGRMIKTPVQLGRREPEPSQLYVVDFYKELLPVVNLDVVHSGKWQLLESTAAWEGNSSHEQFIIFVWSDRETRLLVCVNYSAAPAQCYVRLPEFVAANPLTESPTGKPMVTFRDLTSTAVYDRELEDLAARGLYLDMPAWGYHTFVMESETPDW